MHGLTIDTWYKALVAASLAIAALSSLAKDASVGLIALGLACWGIAAWAGETTQQGILGATFNTPSMTVTRKFFRLTPPAALFGIISLILLSAGFAPIVRTTWAGQLGCAQQVAPLKGDPKVGEAAGEKGPGQR